jgi:hypothetical protein
MWIWNQVGSIHGNKLFQLSNIDYHALIYKTSLSFTTTKTIFFIKLLNQSYHFYYD